MRFNLNTSYPFIFFYFTYSHGGKGGGLGYSSPVPWRDTVNEVKVATFTCAEHHKVNDAYEDESKPAKCEGFVFKSDDTGRVWYNQYPRASYGQLSDHGDGIIFLSDVSKPEIETEDFVFSMYSAFRFLDECVGNIHRLEENLKDPRPWVLPGYIAKAKAHYEDVKAKVEAHTGKTITSSPIVFTDIRTGEKESYPFIVRHRYAD